MLLLKMQNSCFRTPEIIEYVDTLHSVDEERIIAIGKVHGVLCVVFTERPPDIIRLISARKATAKERRLYYGTDC